MNEWMHDTEWKFSFVGPDFDTSFKISREKKSFANNEERGENMCNCI